MRIGCPYCGPRAGRCKTPPIGCFASGENDKKEAVRECILSAALFFVFIAPVGSLSITSSFMRKEVWKNSLLYRRKGAGPMALPWGDGGRAVPCSVVPHLTYEKTSGKADYCIAKWVQGYRGCASPCSVFRGTGYGGKEPPAWFLTASQTGRSGSQRRSRAGR